MKKALLQKPADSVLKRYPLIEIAGQNRVLIENHQGILAYMENEIQVKVSYGCIVINGESLQFLQMSKMQLVICGKIQCVQLLGR